MLIVTDLLSKINYWRNNPYSDGDGGEANPYTRFKKKACCTLGIVLTIVVLAVIGIMAYYGQIRNARNNLECKNCTKEFMN